MKILSNLRQWAESTGSEINSNLQINEFHATGRGIGALKDCYAWANLMRIGPNTLISGKNILEGSSCVVKLMQNSEIKIDVLDCFALWFYSELKKGQRHQNLPDCRSTVDVETIF